MDNYRITGPGAPKMTDDLEPIDPHDALEMYYDDIDGDLAPSTVDAYRYKLEFFSNWCNGGDGDESRVTNLNNLTGRDLTRFKNWRSEGINTVTLRSNLSVLREFLRFCVSIDAVPPSIPEKLNVPTLKNGENQRTTFLEHERATIIHDYLSKFEYASLDHTLFALQWHTGVRMGALHSLDVDDVENEERRLRLAHRPDMGTRLKNGHDATRYVAINDDMATTITDYIEYKRTPVTDDEGRKPLFTTRHGRMDKTNLNRRIYAVTTPCEYGEACPAGKDPHSCEYTGALQRLIECPHNVRPHDVRRGSITHALRSDVPKPVVSDRMNVSSKTLDRHYNQMSEAERVEKRREFLDYI